MHLGDLCFQSNELERLRQLTRSKPTVACIYLD